MKTKTFLFLTGICAVTWFIFTRRSRPKPTGNYGTLGGVFKGMAEEVKKPLSEIASEVPTPAQTK